MDSHMSVTMSVDIATDLATDIRHIGSDIVRHGRQLGGLMEGSQNVGSDVGRHRYDMATDVRHVGSDIVRHGSQLGRLSRGISECR